MTDTLSREDYENARHFGTAGPASLIGEQVVSGWRKESTGWSGKYWTFVASDDGVWTLRAVNVSTRKNRP
ncbi:hypothetical protein DFR70_12738 [Nocardia tenerifensis]|uniref:Uncharacterized protein n=1 Tax=Nocardia tenerifensis TaxID=228006 RepID=A0A318JSY9_9NOCA|nr:hypothetical protein [Nocardia tenerifensis]PXX53427.1 hypothetical protein DFR70_12738 [Nocardia tenerifensis]